MRHSALGRCEAGQTCFHRTRIPSYSYSIVKANSSIDFRGKPRRLRLFLTTSGEEKRPGPHLRAVYLLLWTILARGSNETAVEKRSPRPQISVKRCSRPARRVEALYTSMCRPVVHQDARRLSRACPIGIAKFCWLETRLTSLREHQNCLATTIVAGEES